MTATPADSRVESFPATIGKYAVFERVGAGTMGVVYRCRQPGLNRPVAIKVLTGGGHATPEHLLRFQKEAQAAGKIVHPNVVQVHDVAVDADVVHLDDVGMHDLPRRLSLLLEAEEVLGSGMPTAREDLDGNRAIQSRLAAPIDDSHR